MIIWLFGQPHSGKTTIARELFSGIYNSDTIAHLDGDEFREIFPNKDYSRQGRQENVKRAGIVAHYLEHCGKIVVASFVTPYRSMRYDLKQICGENIKFVYLTYDGDRGRESFHVADFEPPIEGDETFLHLHTSEMSLQDCIKTLNLNL